MIAGLDRDYIGVLIVPDAQACRKIAGTAANLPLEEVLAVPALREWFSAALRRHAESNPGSSQHARRALLLHEPLSIDKGEITDKGSVNQRVVLRERDSLVAQLYAEPPPDHVLVIPVRA